MTKKFLTAALAAMMLIAIPASAKKSTDQQLNKNKMERVDKRFSKTQKTQCLQLSDSCKLNKVCNATACEFDGLDLTDQQKTQLRALKQKQFEQIKVRKDSAKAVKIAAKEKIRADRKAMRDKREGERRAYLKEVKQILGNDKYILFLENQYVQESGRNQPTKKMHPGSGERKFRHDVSRRHNGDMREFARHDKKFKVDKTRRMRDTSAQNQLKTSEETK